MTLRFYEPNGVRIYLKIWLKRYPVPTDEIGSKNFKLDAK